MGRRLVAACPFLLLALAASVATLWPDAFLLTREGLANGEVWRLWTGHLVHASGAHFLIDVGAGLVLLFLAREWKFLLWAAPVASLAIFAVEPGLSGYCGLSGLLHGWTILAAARVAAEHRSGTARVCASLLAIGVLAKAAFEATLGLSLFTTDASMGVPTVQAAHLIGALLGVAWLALRHASLVRLQKANA
jgi:rhomboid family GlyGly-CTERM serine protease